MFVAAWGKKRGTPDWDWALKTENEVIKSMVCGGTYNIP